MQVQVYFGSKFKELTGCFVFKLCHDEGMLR